MQHRKLGRTDLAIAPVVFGGNVFGWTADEAKSFAILDAFVAGLAPDPSMTVTEWADKFQVGGVAGVVEI